MARDQRLVPTLVQNGVGAILGLNLQNGSRRKILQMDAALDLRLDDVAVDGVAQVGVGRKEPGMVASGVHGRPLRA